MSACLLVPSAALGAGEPVFHQLPPPAYSFSMTAGPGGAIWFTGGQASKTGEGGSVVGAVSRPEGSISSSCPRGPPPGRSRLVLTGTAGSQGASTTKLDTWLRAPSGRFFPSGAYDEYTPANHLGVVNSVTAGPDGAVWFTLAYWVNGHRRATAGRIDASGAMTLFPLPRGGSGPSAIVVGPDGNLGSPSAATELPRSVGSRPTGA